MLLQATINDDGSPVRVIAQDGRDRQVYKVELADFIIALTSGENADMMEYFPANNGKLPATLYNFCFARNAARFSCKAVFRFPAGKYLINYCRKDYYVALPELVFFLQYQMKRCGVMRHMFLLQKAIHFIMHHFLMFTQKVKYAGEVLNFLSARIWLM